MDRDMILRMSCVLCKAVDIYTEINMEDYKYKQIDFAESGIFNLPPEGNYINAFEYMMEHKVEKEDIPAVCDALSLEKLKDAFDHPEVQNVSVRYRMRDSNPVIWMESTAILLRELQPAYVCIIDKNVTKEVQYEDVKAENIKKSEYERQLKQQQERIRSLLDGTNTIIYEYDIERDVMSFAGNAPYTKEKIDYAVHNYLMDFDTYGNIYEDDKADFLKQFKFAIEHGGNHEIRYRANYFAKGFRWYKAFVMGLENSCGVLDRIIGRVDDIHTEMKTENELRKRAEIDELTGVLNKATITERVQDAISNLESGKQGALFIFDIDNFKMVNDRLGHLFGDFFLQTAASEISSHFRQEDFVGRIGGDEFMAYMKDAKDFNSMEKKAEKILKACHKIEVPELKTVKCSVGIAAVTGNQTTYEHLFEKADEALYMAKAKGKDCYVLYDSADESQKDNRERLKTQRTSFHTANVEQTLFQYIFRMLYNAADIEQMISAMLKFMGEYMNVSRVYILEYDKDDSSWNNTFEWCMDGIIGHFSSQQIIKLKKSGSKYLNNFDDDGIFYCRDMSVLSKEQKEIFGEDGMISMLQCTILDGGSIRGIVGFDDFKKQQLWSKEQIDMIKFASQVLSSFLMKKRSQDEINETSQSMYEVLDKANSAIYIVEPDTYHILYANAETIKILGENCIGQPCYEKTLGASRPCKKCPVEAYREYNEVCSMRLFNSVLSRWYDVEAKPICWKQKESMMVQCRDVTDLMHQIEELQKNSKRIEE